MVLPVCQTPPLSHLKPEEPHTPTQLSHWPERDCILTEDNLISVQDRREAKHWPVYVTPAQMVNHMTSGRGVYGIYECVHMYVQEVSEGPGQWTTKHSIVCSTGFHFSRVDRLTARTILCFCMCECAEELHVLLEKSIYINSCNMVHHFPSYSSGGSQVHKYNCFVLFFFWSTGGLSPLQASKKKILEWNQHERESSLTAHDHRDEGLHVDSDFSEEVTRHKGFGTTALQ